MPWRDYKGGSLDDDGNFSGLPGLFTMTTRDTVGLRSRVQPTSRHVSTRKTVFIDGKTLRRSG